MKRIENMRNLLKFRNVNYEVLRIIFKPKAMSTTNIVSLFHQVGIKGKLDHTLSKFQNLK